MARTVTIAGATYNDVPALDIPASGGGSARFYDTSDGNAEDRNIMIGMVAYTQYGRVVGTAHVEVDGTQLIMPSGLVVWG